MRERRTSATSIIVRYLLETHRHELGIPHHPGKEVAYLSDMAGIARNTVRGILTGTPRVPTAATRNALARLFSKVIPNIHESWFLDSSLEEFQSRLKRDPLAALRKFLEVAPREFSEIERRLCGTYVCYRYSFESASSKIVRSVLHIARSASESLAFHMSAPRRSADVQKGLEHIEGLVVEASGHLYLIGRTVPRANNASDFRVVTMTISDGGRSTSARTGLLVTARNDSSPVAARMVLLKVDQEPNDLIGFMEQTTRVGTVDELLVHDYGSTAGRYIRYFIDNSLIGAEKEVELKSLEGVRVHPDSTLRVDCSRFYDEIPIVLQETRNKAVNDKSD